MAERRAGRTAESLPASCSNPRRSAGDRPDFVVVGVGVNLASLAARRDLPGDLAGGGRRAGDRCRRLLLTAFVAAFRALARALARGRLRAGPRRLAGAGERARRADPGPARTRNARRPLSRSRRRRRTAARHARKAAGASPPARSSRPAAGARCCSRSMPTTPTPSSPSGRATRCKGIVARRRPRPSAPPTNMSSGSTHLLALAGLERAATSTARSSPASCPRPISICVTLCRHYLNTEPLVVGERRRATRASASMSTGRREVGADRLVNAVAAHDRYKAPLIVVDFGTATTFDVVDQRRQLLRRRHRAGDQPVAARVGDGGGEAAAASRSSAPTRVIGKDTVAACSPASSGAMSG